MHHGLLILSLLYEPQELLVSQLFVLLQSVWQVRCYVLVSRTGRLKG